MTFAIHDHKAIRAATLAFPKDRPQNVVKAVEPVKVDVLELVSGVGFSPPEGWVPNSVAIERGYFIFKSPSV